MAEFFKPNPEFIRVPVWYNESDGEFYIMDGPIWKKISGSGGSTIGFSKVYTTEVNLVAFTPLTITHNINNTSPAICFFDLNGNEIILGIEIINSNSLEITSEVNLNKIKVSVFG